MDISKLTSINGLPSLPANPKWPNLLIIPHTLIWYTIHKCYQLHDFLSPVVSSEYACSTMQTLTIDGECLHCRTCIMCMVEGIPSTMHISRMARVDIYCQLKVYTLTFAQQKVNKTWRSQHKLLWKDSLLDVNFVHVNTHIHKTRTTIAHQAMHMSDMELLFGWKLQETSHTCTHMHVHIKQVETCQHCMSGHACLSHRFG